MHAFARAAGEVALQSAVFSPGVGMGDVAQADDRVAGPNPAAPLGEELPVHVRHVSERPAPRVDHRVVAEVEVRPDPGVFRVRSENRDGDRAELAHQGLQ